MPAKLPWLSNAGFVIIILNVANGFTLISSLLDGVMYGSPGVITIALARSVAGGKLKTDHTPALVNVVAKVDLRVVIAAGISPPVMQD